MIINFIIPDVKDTRKILLLDSWRNARSVPALGNLVIYQQHQFVVRTIAWLNSHTVQVLVTELVPPPNAMDDPNVPDEIKEKITQINAEMDAGQSPNDEVSKSTTPDVIN